LSAPLQRHSFRGLHLQSGEVMPEVTLAYRSWGTLAPDGRNAVLIQHGYTNGPGLVDTPTFGANSWVNLVGPGRAIDTERFFVICPNLLGSCHGSTSGASIDPATGRPYGLRFPVLTMMDIVVSQRVLLDHLGIRRLVAVAGPSLGGALAFQWAITYPGYVAGIVAVICAPMAMTQGISGLMARLMRDPDWHGGDYYGRSAPRRALYEFRRQLLSLYGLQTEIARSVSDPAMRAAALERSARDWANSFDANSLVILGRAAASFDLRPQFGKIKARVLYVLSRTDRVFPPSLAPDVIRRLREAGVDAQYIEVDSECMHYGATTEWEQWAPRLRAFVEGLITQPG
jgi:homoserine O-acetyltransferase/O-succinyltransferase